MNELLTLMQFKHILAKNTEIDPVFINLFCDEFVKLIEEILCNEQEVTVEGIGTFRVVKGEAAPLKTIVYIPDLKIREAVNTPFLHFEPVVITPANKKLSEPKMDTSLDGVQLADVSALPSASNELSIDESIADTVIPIETITPEDRVCSEKYISSISSDCSVVKKEVSRLKQGLIAGTLFLFVVVVGLIVLRVQQNAIKSVIDMPQVNMPPALVVPPDSLLNSVEVEPIDSIATEIVTEITTAMISSPSSRDLPIKESVIVLKPIEVILKKGDRLTMLSERYYGSKFFWVYIYEANKQNYPNPENIPVGAKLVIPPASLFEIDKENKESVDKAKQIARKLLQ